MSKIKFSILSLSSSLVLLVSCLINEKNGSEELETLAFIDNIPIKADMVDYKVRQDLFDQLNRIYAIRKIALDETIKEKLLEIEADKQNISQQDLLNSIINPENRDKLLKKYIEKNEYYLGISDFEGKLSTYDLDSKKGQEILTKRFSDFLVRSYVDSIKKIHNTRILLKPPSPPLIDISRLLIHQRGNLKSRIKCIIISDFECSFCRKGHPVFDSLYLKYHDLVNFGYINYGSYVTPSALSSECAANQGKFWEMHDSLYKLNELPDSAQIFKIAAKLNLNMDKFKSDFNNAAFKKQIDSTFRILSSLGIYGTPTILINNKLIYNSTSIDEIESILLQELRLK